MMALEPIWLTLKLALSTTIILFCLAIPLANWLTVKKGPIQIVIEAIVSLPLVLPPTVLGFYLLLLFSPNHAFGAFIERTFDLRLVFSFPGLLLASLLYSLPFMVHPIKSGLANLPVSLKEAAYSLGKSKRATLIQVLLPNIKPALLTAIVLTFAHTIGEFGVVLMIGGNIPGKTKTASVAIYDAVETFDYATANSYAAVLLGSSFVILVLLYTFNRRARKMATIY
ncbi:molybdate ABC transporter permease subunit [Sphingobacterium oryzagri]|uniref:Molybdenum transport system permease n=1 Tax=Sphingobacterium oryzagri TaxID=3025669 RepID=A0ABY7WAX6_9SPHI|nr:molybdate ABC transporter permease subunit [Sphingobacterium sp. KACC 22765]WDF66816.1 molybdate ABC transporter permease subunit [Sphingobacterium sp. KACC 22765]